MDRPVTMALLPVSDHVHRRRGHGPDMARLARIQSRNPVGLVVAHAAEGAAIEDLWKRFFCIATNSSRAREMVLQRGDLLRSLLRRDAQRLGDAAPPPAPAQVAALPPAEPAGAADQRDPLEA